MVEPIVAFLHQFPPFSEIDESTLTDLCNRVQVRYVAAGETIFERDRPPLPVFFVVRKGLVELHRTAREADELIDYCDEGDLFGVRALLRRADYSARARAKEDSLLYAVPWEPFHALMEERPRLSLYFAAGFAAERAAGEDRLLAATTAAHRVLGRRSVGSDHDGGDELMAPIRDVLTCRPDTSIRRAAGLMRERRVGSLVVVDDERHPIGMITDTDLRDRVVSEGLDTTLPVDTVMSSPVICVREPQTIADLTALTMQRSVHHFCFTDDGTPGSPVSGVLSVRDIVAAYGNHPTGLRARIARTRDPDRLAELRDRADVLVRSYLDQQAGMPLICSVVSGINDALIRSAIDHAQAGLRDEGLHEPPEPFCWLSFGSEGREEQLLRTDLDNAIVYRDPPDSRAESVASYYLELGRRAIDVLVHAGFERCPGNIMASNPDLTVSSSRWKQKFSRLIRTPQPRALMEACIYFDFRPVTGDHDLAEELRHHIFEEIDHEPAFINFLAKNALLNPPPLSFFRGFVLERSGEHAEAFDIKARAMMPLADGARVLAYDMRLPYYGTTSGRYAQVGAACPELAELCSESAMAYDLLLRIRAQEGFRTGTSGRYVDIHRLNKLQRQSLRNTFSVAQDLQRRLESRYRTDFIR